MDSLQGWLGSPLGQGEFRRVVRGALSDESYEVLMKWASNPRLHLEPVEQLRMLRALLEGWELVEFPQGGGSPARWEQLVRAALVSPGAGSKALGGHSR
jgi:hypothetical protein